MKTIFNSKFIKRSIRNTITWLVMLAMLFTNIGQVFIPAIHAMDMAGDTYVQIQSENLLGAEGEAGGEGLEQPTEQADEPEAGGEAAEGAGESDQPTELPIGQNIEPGAEEEAGEESEEAGEDLEQPVEQVGESEVGEESEGAEEAEESDESGGSEADNEVTGETGDIGEGLLEEDKDGLNKENSNNRAMLLNNMSYEEGSIQNPIPLEIGNIIELEMEAYTARYYSITAPEDGCYYARTYTPTQGNAALANICIGYADGYDSFIQEGTSGYVDDNNNNYIYYAKKQKVLLLYRLYKFILTYQIV